MPLELQLIDYAIIAIGGICALGVVAHLASTGRWRDPLAGLPPRRHGPDIVISLGLLALFFVLTSIVLGVLVGLNAAGMLPSILSDYLALKDLKQEIFPGTQAFHAVQSIDMATKLLLCLAMVAVLVHARAFRDAGVRCGLIRGIVAGVLATLVLLPIATVQLQAGNTVWNWLWPSEAAPQHPVLEALPASEWGIWGTIQLVLGAVVIAPLVEELMFRGVLLTCLHKQLEHRWAAVIITGTIFGLIHAPVPQAIVPLVTMGILLGYLRLRTGSIGPCILVHALFNGRTMLFTLLALNTMG